MTTPKDRAASPAMCVKTLANIDVVLAPAHEHERSRGVDENADAGNPHDRVAFDGQRLGESAGGLDDDGARGDQKKGRIAECG
jgi:hypothetical protein